MADIGMLHQRGQHQLGQTELAECRAECLLMLKVDDSNVRCHALIGLSAVGDSSHLPDIRKQLDHHNLPVRRYAKEAVDAIEKREKLVAASSEKE